MSDLLATIVASRHLQPEPVATDALVHLCNRTAAADVLSDLLSQFCPGATTDGLRSTGQELDPELPGRPDLVATDTSGTRLVIEAKFDADLTAAQLSNAYIQRLTSGVPGALVFLVPADRMRNVWMRVVMGQGGGPAPALTDQDIDSGIIKLALPAGHVLAAMSWDALLHRLAAGLAKQGDHDGIAELDQIRGLVDWRSRTGWNPVLPEDLPQRTGRQLQALSEALRRACSAATTGRLRNGSGDGGPGKYIATATGKSLWAGLWFDWWDRYGPGPAWAQVKSKNTTDMALISEAFTAAGIQHHPRTKTADVLIPLDVPVGAELAAVETHLAARLGALAAVLDSLAVEVVDEPEQVEAG